MFTWFNVCEFGWFVILWLNMKMRILSYQTDEEVWWADNLRHGLKCLHYKRRPHLFAWKICSVTFIDGEVCMSRDMGCGLECDSITQLLPKIERHLWNVYTNARFTWFWEWSISSGLSINIYSCDMLLTVVVKWTLDHLHHKPTKHLHWDDFRSFDVSTWLFD